MEKKENKTDSVYNFDQFFTKPQIAKLCVENLTATYSLDNFDLIIEPSAGTGSFFELIPNEKRIGIELDFNLCKKNALYKHMSFFDFSISDNNILVLGNPPFGTQNNLSIDFFNHAATFADTIAFIIPKTWKKDSVQNRLNKYFHLIKSMDLPEDSFYGAKKTTVKCCFQIWKKQDNIRSVNKKILSHKDWDFLNYINSDGRLSPNKNADFIILAYGSNSGQLSDDLYRWRPKSVHFIKSKIEIEILKERFLTLDYSDANNSARQSSLCKGDLVKLYIERYGV
jgi:hypothetical protein